MNCIEARAALPEFVYGGLTPRIQAQVDDHLNGCPECGREAATLCEVRRLLVAAPDVRVNTAAIYHKAAEQQAQRVRRWRRIAVSACAAVIALIAVAALTRLEIRVGNAEMVVRWGPAPLPQAPPPAPLVQDSPLAAAKPVDLSSIEDRLRVLSELTQALAEDNRDRDDQREREIAHLRAQMKDWQGQSAQRFGAVERDFDALYTAQFPSHKGGKP